MPDEQSDAVIGDRLKAAFAGVKPPAYLAERIRSALREPARGRGASEKSDRPRVVPIAPWLQRALMAAAAVVLVGVGLWVFFGAAPKEAIARDKLIELHQRVLANRNMWEGVNDPEAIRTYLSDKLGIQAAAPVSRGRMCLCGCCIEIYDDQKVGTYAVDLPEGKVTVMVMRVPPATFGARREMVRNGVTIHTTASSRCRIAVVKIGELHYYALGEVAIEVLADVLADMSRSNT